MAKRYAQVAATPGGGGGGSSLHPMGVGSDTTLLSTLVVIGGTYFNPTLFSGSVMFRLVGFYTSTDGASEARVYLYDMGPGTGAFTPVRRAVVEIPFSNVGQVVKVDQAITLVASPGVDLNQIHNTPRVYEARMYLAATNGSMDVSWTGFEVG